MDSDTSTSFLDEYNIRYRPDAVKAVMNSLKNLSAADLYNKFRQLDEWESNLDAREEKWMRRLHKLGTPLVPPTMSQNASIDSRHGYDPHSDHTGHNHSISLLMEEFSKEEASSDAQAPHKAVSLPDVTVATAASSQENWLMQTSSQSSSMPLPEGTNTPPLSPRSS